MYFRNSGAPPSTTMHVCVHNMYYIIVIVFHSLAITAQSHSPHNVMTSSCAWTMCMDNVHVIIVCILHMHFIIVCILRYARHHRVHSTLCMSSSCASYDVHSIITILCSI